MASAEPLVPSSPASGPRPSRAKTKPSSRIMCGVVVATAGSLGPGWSDADVARWMGHHGGRFVAALADDSKTDEVTHVLCTLEEFSKPKKQQCANLRRALARGPGKQRGVHIVLQDWLEDSLHKRRRVRETGYLLRNVHRESKQTPDELKKKLAEQQARGQRQAETFVNTALYRVYQDCTGFAYKVTISRDHEAAGILGERYVLYLFESLAQPRLYWFAARHYKSRRHTKPLDFRPSGSCGLFSTEFSHFCAFFRKKTGIAWDARLVGEARGRTAASGRGSAGGMLSVPVVSSLIATRPDEPVDPVLPCISGETFESSAASTSAYFKYERPARGQPVGAIENAENLPPEDGADDIVIAEA